MDVLLLLLLLGAASKAVGFWGDGWSLAVQPEVRAVDGYPVVLHCTFSHPQNSQHALLRVWWRLGGRVLFRCTNRVGSPSCDPGPHQDQRYRLEGNPSEHDLSLWINSATLQDSGRYYCGLEVEGREQVTLEEQFGTRLRVEAPPKVLSVSVEGSELMGYRAVCRVQGSPPPDVQWLEGAGPEEQTSAHSPHTVSRLRQVEPGRQYTCSATNPLGRELTMLYVAAPHAGPAQTGAPPPLLLLLAVSLGAKVILLVGVGVWLVQGGTTV